MEAKTLQDIVIEEKLEVPKSYQRYLMYPIYGRTRQEILVLTPRGATVVFELIGNTLRKSKKNKGEEEYTTSVGTISENTNETIGESVAEVPKNVQPAIEPINNSIQPPPPIPNENIENFPAFSPLKNMASQPKSNDIEDVEDMNQQKEIVDRLKNLENQLQQSNTKWNVLESTYTKVLNEQNIRINQLEKQFQILQEKLQTIPQKQYNQIVEQQNIPNPTTQIAKQNIFEEVKIFFKRFLAHPNWQKICKISKIVFDFTYKFFIQLVTFLAYCMSVLYRFLGWKKCLALALILCIGILTAFFWDSIFSTNKRPTHPNSNHSNKFSTQHRPNQHLERTREPKSKDDIPEMAILSELAKSQDSLERQRAADGFGDTGTQVAGSQLLKLLEDSDEGVRVAAIQNLAKIRNYPAGKNAILEIFEKRKDTSSVIKEIVISLAEIGTKQDTEILLKMLNDSKNDDELRVNIIQTLGAICDAKSIRPLIELLKDQSDYIREASAKALGPFESQFSVEPLIKVMHEDSFDGAKIAAIESLSYFNNSNKINTIAKEMIQAYQNTKEGLVKNELRQSLPKLFDYVSKDLQEEINGLLK